MINVDHLTKRYGTVTAVDSLSFEVGPGRVTGFLGPNGAGKTTTLRMLLGLTAPTSGTATINGVRYRDLPNPVRTVGAALEADCFHPGRSGAEHLRIMATAAGISRRRVAQVLDIVGLAEAGHRRVGTYLTPAGARAVSGSVGGHDWVDTLETRYANAWGWRPSRPPPTIGLQTAEMTPSGAAAPTSAPRW